MTPVCPMCSRGAPSLQGPLLGTGDFVCVVIHSRYLCQELVLEPVSALASPVSCGRSSTVLPNCVRSHLCLACAACPCDTGDFVDHRVSAGLVVPASLMEKQVQPCDIPFPGPWSPPSSPPHEAQTHVPSMGTAGFPGCCAPWPPRPSHHVPSFVSGPFLIPS